MNAVRGRGRLGSIVAGVALVGLVAMTAGCGGSSDAADASTTTAGAPASITVLEGGSTVDTSAETTSTAAGTSTSLPNATESQHSAPGNGKGTALLKTVRVGRHEGFERIVFEFVGNALPGYRVQWVDGPITADGSGEPVEVDGDAFLEIVMQPASGVDLSAPQLTIVYEGPDRIPVQGQTALITDLVRTGDFEAVLSWAAGTTQKVPFRVITFQEPARIAIDLQTP